MFISKKELGDLRREIKQLKCNHDKFFIDYIDYVEGYLGKDLVVYTCKNCGHVRYRFWNLIPRNEQEALQKLKQVPDYWPLSEIKTRKEGK